MSEQEKSRTRLDAPDLTAADFALLKAAARRAYAEGRVVVHDGWIVSQVEFDTLVAPSVDIPAASEPTAGG